MNELNRATETRPVITRDVHTVAEGTRQVDTEAANVRQVSGNDVPKVSPDMQVENHSADAAQAIRSQVEEAVASLNEYARKSQRNLEFSVDSELGRPVVQVLDASTQEVIRQIPSETVLEVARNLHANLEQLRMQRAAQQAGVDGFVSADVSLGLVNTHV